MRRSWMALAGIFVALWCSAPAPTRADVFDIVDDAGEPHRLEGKIVGDAQGVVAIALSDGRYELVPPALIKKRVAQDGPEPMSPTEVLERLQKKFTPELFRGMVDKPYVVGIVFSEPLSPNAEVRAGVALKKAAKFFKTVEGVIEKFFAEMGIKLEQPEYPLVALIFETDDRFEEFAAETTGNRGLSSGNILGFYSGLSNQLYLRMSECHTFETPLHEAVHQQVMNRGVFQRLAPVPAWLNEGMATGFEANGEKIGGGPTKLNPRYAQVALEAKAVDWPEIVANDRAFRGDILASEAYSHAWSLHWLLVTKYKKQYAAYLKKIGESKTLEPASPRERQATFDEIFGKSVTEMQTELLPALQSAVKKTKVVFKVDRKPGWMYLTQNLGEVEMSAARVGGGPIVTEGKLRNLSTIRPMSFHVTVESGNGLYSEYFVPNLAPHKMVPLNKAVVSKPMAGARGGDPGSFRVRVRAVVSESEAARQWQNGQLPVPKFESQ